MRNDIKVSDMTEQVVAAVTTFIFIEFEVFTAVAMKNAVFWDAVLLRSC
jgi:hypothetical protein